VLIRGIESKPVRGGFALARNCGNQYHFGMAIIQDETDRKKILELGIQGRDRMIKNVHPCMRNPPKPDEEDWVRFNKTLDDYESLQSRMLSIYAELYPGCDPFAEQHIKWN